MALETTLYIMTVHSQFKHRTTDLHSSWALLVLSGAWLCETDPLRHVSLAGPVPIYTILTKGTRTRSKATTTLLMSTNSVWSWLRMCSSTRHIIYPDNKDVATHTHEHTHTHKNTSSGSNYLTHFTNLSAVQVKKIWVAITLLQIFFLVDSMIFWSWFKDFLLLTALHFEKNVIFSIFFFHAMNNMLWQSALIR